MAKFQKGDTVWVATLRYNELEVSCHKVVSCGGTYVGLDGHSRATRYSKRVRVKAAHVTRRAALESLLEGARDGVEAAREELKAAEALLSTLSAEIETERTPAESSSP
jgi:hypothetical protein